MEKRKINEEILKKFKDINLKEDLQISSEKNGGTKHNFNDVPNIFNNINYLYNKIEEILPYIVDGGDSDCVGKVEILINQLVGYISQLKGLSKVLGDGTNNFDNQTNSLQHTINNYTNEIKNFKDGHGISQSLTKLQNDYLLNLMEIGGLKTLEGKIGEVELVIENVKKLEGEVNKNLENIEKQTNKVGTLELSNISQNFIKKYNRQKWVFFGLMMLFSIGIVLYSFCSFYSLEGLVHNKENIFQMYYLLPYFTKLIIYSIGIYLIGFFSKEYKKSDTMVTFNENKKSIESSFLGFNNRVWGNNEGDIKRDLFSKTIDGLYRVPESIYSIGDDKFPHEKIIERVIDKIPTK